MRTLTGSKSLRNVAQHRSRPHGPMPPCTRASSRGAELPQLDPAGVAGQVADERAEVDAVRRGEVDDDVLVESPSVEVVDADHLHRQVVLADQPLGDDPGLGPAPAVALVAGQVLVGRAARRTPAARRCPRSTHCGAHTHSATSGPASVGTSTLSPTGLVAAGVEVVEPSVAGETYTPSPCPRADPIGRTARGPHVANGDLRERRR